MFALRTVNGRGFRKGVLMSYYSTILKWLQHQGTVDSLIGGGVEKMYGYGPRFALLGTIFLSFGCLIAAFRSLASFSGAYNRESRMTAITGFIFGLIFSVIFGLATIFQLNRMHVINELMLGG